MSSEEEDHESEKQPYSGGASIFCRIHAAKNTGSQPSTLQELWRSTTREILKTVGGGEKKRRDMLAKAKK
ncbi:hypothetical protein K438DRAFT_1261997 [Mycena galopus ATCC 62051]|nr:hypothetical protein K438DRAFT_1261997 [Mycena galopus ATCC 62051]